MIKKNIYLILFLLIIYGCAPAHIKLGTDKISKITVYILRGEMKVIYADSVKTLIQRDHDYQDYIILTHSKTIRDKYLKLGFTTIWIDFKAYLDFIDKIGLKLDRRKIK